MNKLSAIASRRLANHRGISMIRATSQKGFCSAAVPDQVERQAQDKGTRQNVDRVAQKRALRVRIMSGEQRGDSTIERVAAIRAGAEHVSLSNRVEERECSQRKRGQEKPDAIRFPAIR